MKFGICTSFDHAPAAKAAGWDYVEASVQSLLKGEVSDAEWDGMRQVGTSPLPTLAANMLVPANLKITGPDVNPEALRTYMDRVTRRAKQAGIETLVFGSGGARQVPEGFDRNKANQ